ncbi:LysR family transcriptional regulator [Shewanella gelidii]|uniref:LysR family transcriptional regulator n=2 Tax=Shewanella gelidii TaxID=1642821 RepID=A0A917NDM7_9GAMM|nr:LysR family transcriptional regulator [Shewanella gelidii]GGI87605.1 LysR family transcriptional regulator [Shewanella gelidii]
MHITLKQLSVLKVVAESGQISKAARQLHLSVPAVSMTLKELESSLDTRLFERTSTGLVITESGNLVLVYANTILSKVNQLKKLFHERATGLGGTLRIGANKTSGNYVLSKRLPYFKTLYPSIDVSLKILSSTAIEDMVMKNELDLAVIGNMPTSHELEYIQWRSDRLCMVASPSHKFARRKPTVSDLCSATWIMDEQGSNTRTQALSLLRSADIHIHDEIIMNTMGALKRGIGTGLGLGILPLLSVDAELERGDLQEIDFDVETDPRYLYIIYKPHQFTPLVEKFLKCCDVEIDRNQSNGT